MEINLIELAECNKIGKEWARLAGYKPTKYFNFISDLKTNIEKIKECLGERFEEFVAVKDIILSPEKYQDYLCNKHEKGVYFWANKYKSNHVSLEERISYGYEGIWRAIFNYTRPECSLDHFVFYNIRTYVRVSINHEIQKFTAIKRAMFGTAIRIESPSNSKTRKSLSATLADPNAKTSDEIAQINELPQESELLDSWLKKANITDEENIRILNFYIRRDEFPNNGWVDKYLEDLNHRKGISRAKSGIKARLKQVKEILATVAM